MSSERSGDQWNEIDVAQQLKISRAKNIWKKKNS